jgi:hypothetical protein
VQRHVRRGGGVTVKVQVRFPAGPAVEVDALLAGVAAEPAGGRLRAGDDRVVRFLTGFARRLLAPAVARRFPELGSLGFFLRRAELTRLARRMRTGPDGQTVVSARGLVFHVPPANVDTIFVYSWALSALAGNPNIVRVSERAAGAAQAVLEALNDTLAEADPVIAGTQAMIGYGRDDAVTAALSAACDLRVIWGGDTAVRQIRAHPLAPHARDLTFPDRASFAAINTAGWLAATGQARRAAVRGFVNDAYWFDQAACASPRTLFLIGDPETTQDVRGQFLALLGDVVREQAITVDAAMAVQKHVATYGLAAQGAATRVTFTGNTVAAVDLTDPPDLPRRWLGAGTFPITTLDALTDLVPLIQRKDQTLTHFGFDHTDLHTLAAALGGRGIDRIVPFGNALTFHTVWDGYDLPREFTRLTTITT